MPKVSVIVPVYNVEKYLRKCLDSVVNQTLEDIEIICIDDGSTDGSGAILDEYAQKDKRIKVIHQENQGLGAARNVGIDLAKGEYIGFVDSDDFIELSCLEKVYSKIEETSSDLCLFGIYRYNSILKIPEEGDSFNLSHYGENVSQICRYTNIKKALFTRFSACAKLYQTDFVKKNKLYFPVGIYFEDVFPHIRNMVLAQKICFFDENLYYYRANRTESIMNDPKKEKKKISDLFTVIDSVYHFLQQRKIYSDLQNEFIDYLLEQTSYHKIHTALQFKDQFKKRCVEIVKQYELLSLICQNERWLKTYKNLINQLNTTKKYRLFGFIPLLKIEEK